MSEEDDDLGAPHSARPMTFSAAVVWTLGAWLLWSVIVSVTESARPGAVTDLVNVTACAVLAYSVLIFAMLRVYAPEASVRDVLGVRAVSPIGVGLALAGGVALAPALDFIDRALLRRFPRAPEDAEFGEKLLHATSLGERIVLVAALAFVFPICQELFFRGVLFRGLRRRQVEGLAVVSSAMLFAASDASGDFRGMASGIVLGLFAAWLRARSGSLAPAVGAHVAYAAVSALPLAMGKGDVELGPRAAVGGIVAAAVFAWGAGMVFRRDVRAEQGRLLDA